MRVGWMATSQQHKVWFQQYILFILQWHWHDWSQPLGSCLLDIGLMFLQAKKLFLAPCSADATHPLALTQGVLRRDQRPMRYHVDLFSHIKWIEFDWLYNKIYQEITAKLKLKRHVTINNQGATRWEVESVLMGFKKFCQGLDPSNKGAPDYNHIWTYYKK